MPYSPATGLPIESQTVSQMVDRIMAMQEGTRLLLLAPIVRGRKGEYRKELADLQKRGFQRVKIDGKMYEIDEVADARQEAQARYRGRGRPHRRARGARQRGSPNSIETALKLADGLAIAENADSGERDASSRPNSPARSRASPFPRSSRGCSRSTTRIGACPACDGLGTKLFFDPELVVPDERQVLARGRDRALGRIRPRNITRRRSTASRGTTKSAPTRPGRICRRKSARRSCSARARRRSRCATTTACAAYTTTRPFEGVIPNMERRFKETDSAWLKEELGRYQNTHRARPATAIASSPRRSRSRSTGSISARSATSRSPTPATGSARSTKQADAEAARHRRSAS